MFNLKVEVASVSEQAQVLRDTLASRQNRIAELESENIRIAKENIYLNSELDEETHKNTQVRRAALETPGRRQEALIAQYERRSNALESEIRRLKDNEDSDAAASKVDVELLRAENENLRGQVTRQKKQLDANEERLRSAR